MCSARATSCSVEDQCDRYVRRLLQAGAEIERIDMEFSKRLLREVSIQK